MYIFSRIRPAICSTIFKTDFLKETGMEFTAGCHFGEDVEFLTKAFSICKKIGFSTKCSYIYVHHNDMTLMTSASTKDRFIRRYADNAAAVYRAARYLAERSPSPKLRDIAMSFMMAEGLIKTLNAAAMRQDETEFYRILREAETRRALKASRRYFLQKPEVFIKAACLLIAPGAYFRRRSKSCG
jgi:hypothetical protein